MTYHIWICPQCHEQLEDDYGHTHDDIAYQPARINVTAIEHADDLLAQARADSLTAYAEIQRRQAESEAELAQMEADWRTTAPQDQIQAYEAHQAKHRGPTPTAKLSTVLKEVYTDPDFKERNEASNRVTQATLLGTKQDRAQALADLQAIEQRQLQDTIQRFKTEGPATVPFWKLRDATTQLAALKQNDR